MEEKNIVVMYHGGCPDGLAGAYAAWKKFGDTAAYVPLTDRLTPPAWVVGREVYLIDYSYPLETLKKLEEHNARLVVLDHHSGVQDAVRAVREHVFDSDRSGATIAWTYFHPHVQVPRLISYIEDNDLWRKALPHHAAVASWYAVHTPETFDMFDDAVRTFEDDARFMECVEAGTYYYEEYQHIAESVVSSAELVEFEGYRVLAVNCHREMRSLVGSMLTARKPPFGIVWRYEQGVWRISLRGDGTVDLAALAQKYGGSGHRVSAACSVPYPDPLPFTFVSEHLVA